MKYELDIDLGALADEWEPVAFRKPKEGERYLSVGYELPTEALFDFETESHLIVRRRWKWPEWLTAEWYFETHDGEQYVSDGLPVVSGDVCQIWTSKNMRRITGITTCPKIGGDWRQSKRRNPSAK